MPMSRSGVLVNGDAYEQDKNLAIINDIQKRPQITVYMVCVKQLVPESYQSNHHTVPPAPSNKSTWCFSKM